VPILASVAANIVAALIVAVMLRTPAAPGRG
jgi:hypothetical protein